MEEGFKFIHQIILTKIKNSSRQDWAAETIVKRSIKIFEC